jgi:Sec-independent protein translocase protein TatA
MTPPAIITLGVWEIVVIIVALAILLGVPMVVVAACMWVRRIIREGRKSRSGRTPPPAEASES